MVVCFITILYFYVGMCGGRNPILFQGIKPMWISKILVMMKNGCWKTQWIKTKGAKDSYGFSRLAYRGKNILLI